MRSHAGSSSWPKTAAAMLAGICLATAGAAGTPAGMPKGEVLRLQKLVRIGG